MVEKVAGIKNAIGEDNVMNNISLSIVITCASRGSIGVLKKTMLY